MSDPKILVSHPNAAAVAQGTAAAFSAHGRLSAFVTGTPHRLDL